MENNTIWKVILQINKFVRELQFFENLLVTIYPEITVSANVFDKNLKNSFLITRRTGQISDDYLAVFYVDEQYTIQSTKNINLIHEEFELLKEYLPYILIYFKAVNQQKSYVISHFAQSLDGKIATISGNSKWIGNQENLIHAHRMRALCDGILVGANTYLRDKPRLTVRHVEGCDPVRIILGNSSFNEAHFKNTNNHTICLTSLNGAIKESVKDDTVLCFSLRDGLIDPNEITKWLFKKGIYTVYLEGGAFTSSYFLKKKAIDMIQLYFSPTIFGSGISSFSLNQIDSINEAITFRDGKFTPMGKDGIMFSGEVNYSQNGS
jgi:diaminohydroxyphosphoribosylaminopyrimidine deaminase/5-amino-6-(5-phosphoribosylamino)uracil reductase